MLRTFADRTAHGCLLAAAALAFALAFLIVADVAGRSLFSSPVQGTPELVSSALVVICFLQAPYAIRSGGMISVDFLLTKAARPLQAMMTGLGALVGAAFFLFIVWGSVEPTLHAWNSGEYEGEGALHVPVWPVRMVLIVGCLLGAVSYLLLAIDNLGAALRGEGPPPAPRLGADEQPVSHL
jgi:TRAP-type C4-dicarboxylate transport system permease small subunit